MQECKQLRGDIDEQHKIRMEAFEFKMQPIVINEEPSRKVTLNMKTKLTFFFVASWTIKTIIPCKSSAKIWLGDGTECDKEH